MMLLRSGKHSRCDKNHQSKTPKRTRSLIDKCQRPNVGMYLCVHRKLVGMWNGGSTFRLGNFFMTGRMGEIDESNAGTKIRWYWARGPFLVKGPFNNHFAISVYDR